MFHKHVPKLTTSNFISAQSTQKWRNQSPMTALLSNGYPLHVSPGGTFKFSSFCSNSKVFSFVVESRCLGAYVWESCIVTNPYVRGFQEVFSLKFISNSTFDQIAAIVRHPTQEFHLQSDWIRGITMTWDICSGWDAHLSTIFCGISFRSIGAMGSLKFSKTAMSIRNPRSVK